MTAQPQPSLAESGESAAFGRLARLVSENTGFRDGPGFRTKLRAIFGGGDEETAATWLRLLSRASAWNGEWQHVVGRLTVPETFFFRDAPQLDVLRNRVLPALVSRKRAGSRAIRVWSAGCSSGEEPYTLAMLLLDALVAAGEAIELPGGIEPNPGWRLTVNGTDINARVVERARDGIYADVGLSPFRDTPPQYRRFFVAKDAPGGERRFAVRRDIRSMVEFAVHNLKGGPVGWDYDIVSCRNVLIYFDDATKATVLGNLTRAVGDGGALLLGPTDPFDGLTGLRLLDPRTSPVLSREAPRQSMGGPA